jgi:hypothetical protein
MSSSESDVYGYSGDEAHEEQEPENTARICTVCFNLKLFLEPNSGLHMEKPEQIRIKDVLHLEVERSDMRSRCVVKVEFFELLESTRLGDCTYCQFVFNCLRTMNAEVDESKSTIVRVLARKDLPFYIYWHDKYKGPLGMQVYAYRGTCCFALSRCLLSKLT